MKNKVLGIGAILLAAWEAWMTMGLKPSMIAAGDPGPKVFPMISAALFLICGIAILFQKEKPGARTFLTREQWKRLITLFVILIGYALLMLAAGFLISTVVVLFVVCTLFAGSKQPPLWIRILYAVVLAFAVSYLLNGLFQIPLPEGLLFE